MATINGNNRSCKCGTCKGMADVKTSNRWLVFDIKVGKTTPIMHTTKDGRVVELFARCEVPGGIDSKNAWLISQGKEPMPVVKTTKTVAKKALPKTATKEVASDPAVTKASALIGALLAKGFTADQVAIIIANL